MKNNRSIHALAILTLALTVACDRGSGNDNDNPTPATSDPLAAVFTGESFAVGERPIHQMREGLEPGAAVAFEGKVMGRLEVFVPGRAAFIVGDPTILTSCDQIAGDPCETPWDVCCDDPDNITKGILTVQLVDDEGRVLARDLRGFNGLTELSSVRIEGVVAEGSGGENLIVNASRIHVLP